MVVDAEKTGNGTDTKIKGIDIYFFSSSCFGMHVATGTKTQETSKYNFVMAARRRNAQNARSKII